MRRVTLVKASWDGMLVEREENDREVAVRRRRRRKGVGVGRVVGDEEETRKRGK